MYLIVLKQLVIMALIALAGFSFTKIFSFGKTEQTFVSRLLLYVINPCMILRTFNIEFEKERFMELLAVIGISLLAHLALTLLALVFCRSKNETEKDLDPIDKISVIFTNCGFIGIPLINGIFGQGGTFYLMGYIAIFNLSLWTYGYYFIAGKVNIKKIITNPNIIAVLLGILIYCLPFKLPTLIAQPISFIGDMNTATSMLLLGMLFATFKKPEISLGSYVLRLAKICSLRLIASAVIMFFVCFAAFKLLKNFSDIRTMCYVVFIAALCPVGMSVSGLAVLFKKDESYASLIVGLTSLFCLVTLPLSVAIAEKFF